MNDTLKVRQAASAQAERKMLEMLLSFEAAQKLTVADVQYIARYARTLAFDCAEQVSA